MQSGTDYKPFIQMYGVPSLDIRYLYDKVFNLIIFLKNQARRSLGARGGGCSLRTFLPPCYVD